MHLGLRLDAELAKYATAKPAKQVELHAKAIWNGHERMKGPFRSLQTKDQMKSFLLDICKVIRSSPPLIAIAFAHESTFPKGVLEKEHPKTALSTALRRELVMSAISRLDDNLTIVTGKHVGRAKFLLDHESDQVFQTEKGRAKDGKGFGSLSHVAYDKRDPSQPDRWPHYVSVDPVYSFSYSESSRLIQVADLAAYFVGKYFSLAAIILRSQANNETPDNAQALRDDLTFCLTIWNALNVDVTLLLNSEQVPQLPEWLVNILTASVWRDPFRIRVGEISYQCVLRERCKNNPTTSIQRLRSRRASRKVMVWSADDARTGFTCYGASAPLADCAPRLQRLSDATSRTVLPTRSTSADVFEVQGLFKVRLR